MYNILVFWAEMSLSIPSPEIYLQILQKQDFQCKFIFPFYFLRLYADTIWTIDKMLFEGFVSCHWIILWHHFARNNYLFVFRNVLGTSINANSLLDRWGFLLFVVVGGGGVGLYTNWSFHSYAIIVFPHQVNKSISFPETECSYLLYKELHLLTKMKN